MKILRRACIGLATMLLILIVMTSSLSKMHHDRIDVQVNSIRAKLLETPSYMVSGLEAERSTGRTVTAEPLSDEDVVTENSNDLDEEPPPLMRVPVGFVQSTMKMSTMEGSDYWGLWFEVKMTKLRRTLSETPLLDDTYPSSFTLAQQYMELGDWDAAKPLLWQTLDDEPEEIGLTAALNLVFLEDDPRVIEKLLHRSCEADYLSHLALAVEYCHHAGSEELKAYYVRRLYAAYPEEADEFMERFEEEQSE